MREPKLNYSAKQIQHVYKKKKEKERAVVKKFEDQTGVKTKFAFGMIYINIEDVLTDKENNYPFKFKHYGGVNFLGNINDKTANHLYYKNKLYKEEFEIMTAVLEQIDENAREAIKTIENQHGKPNVQHGILAHEL